MPDIGRVILYTKRMEELVAFYVKAFGYRPVGREGDRIVELRPPGDGLVLMLHPAAKGQREGQSLVKLVFRRRGRRWLSATADRHGCGGGAGSPRRRVPVRQRQGPGEKPDFDLESGLCRVGLISRLGNPLSRIYIIPRRGYNMDMDAADLSIRETAVLAGVPKKTIEKAIETGIMEPVSRSVRMPGKTKQFLSLQAVAYFSALETARLLDLPVHHKKAIWRKLSQQAQLLPNAIEFSPGTVLRVKELSQERVAAASRYRSARDEFIEARGDILGGTPVIRGTRMTVYAVLGRLQGGETIDDLVEDNPDIPREAFEVAELFAKTHPMRGRPGGRPWRNVA